jgi:hypothetical protein
MFLGNTHKISMIASKESIVRDGLVLYLDASNSSSYPGSGTTWYDISGNNRNFSWLSTPSFTTGSPSYFATNIRCVGPASNSFGINNTSGYTIFVACNQITLLQTHAFNFYGSGTYNRGIFAHLTWSDNNVYFDQGGCCSSDTRTYVASGGSQSWNIWTFRRFTNSSTRTISKNGSTLTTNTAAAANINLTSTGAAVVDNASWNARLNLFLAYNRGLSDLEIQQNYKVLKGRYGL